MVLTAQNVALPALALLWQAPPAAHDDVPALKVAPALLSAGESSRLHEALVYRARVAQSAGVELMLNAICAITLAGRPEREPANSRGRPFAVIRERPLSSRFKVTRLARSIAVRRGLPRSPTLRGSASGRPSLGSVKRRKLRAVRVSLLLVWRPSETHRQVVDWACEACLQQVNSSACISKSRPAMRVCSPSWASIVRPERL